MLASRSIWSFFLSLACTFALVSAATVPHDAHDHAPTRTRLPTNWYHSEEHAAHALFRRGPVGDGANYPTVGSPEWRAAYPQSTPDPKALPQAWVDALNAAVAAGKIPNIPPSNPTAGNPVYPNNLDPMSDQICSATYKCRKNAEIVWDAPDGVFATSFDDGPQPASDRLYQFLQQNDVHATHFFIGVNILNNPNEFTLAFETLQDDIALHTWTHPHMTTLNNLDLLGQFGWTMQIIHDSTGGRLPRYWRPPFGDSDNRVAAIAKEIFGLTTVIWNQDTEDWSIPSGGTTNQIVQQSMTKWLTGSKTPGLIILEHELYNQTVQAFIDAYPLIKSNGWKIVSVAQLDGDVYLNSPSSTGPVTLVNGVLDSGSDTGNSSSTSSTTSSASSTNTPSSSPTTTPATTPASPSPSGGTALQQNGAVSPLSAVPSALFVSSFFLIISTVAFC